MSDNAGIAKNRAIYSPAHVFLAALLLAVAIFVQYMPAINYGFLGWDDTSYIQDDSVVIRGLSKDSLHYAFTTFDNPYFMPLTRLSYMVDVSLYGIEKAAGFRLTNILLHIITSILLFLLVYRATSRFIAAFLVGLIFGIHPQHVEAVVWIAGRKELLAGLFGIISLASYQQYAIFKKQEWYLVSLLAYGCSLLNKPIWIALPVLLLLWDFYPLKRLDVKNARQWLLEKMPFLIVGLVYAFIFTHSITISDTPVSYFPDEPWSSRWLLPILAVAKYILNTFIPVNLMPYYAFPDKVDVYMGLVWTGLLLVLLAIFWKVRQKYPALLMAALWFGIALSAALKLTLFPQGEAIFVGDRYSYLAHIGMFTGIILTLDTWIINQYKYVKYGAFGFMLLVLVALPYCAYNTIIQWRSPEQLWNFTAEHTEGKGKAYILALIGSNYRSEERFKEALLSYQKAYQIYPQSFVSPMMIGSILGAHLGQHDASEIWFDKLLNESPAPSDILLDYGTHLYRKGENLRAERFLTKAVERYEQEGNPLKPKEMYVLLGFAQMRNNHIDKAIGSLTRANLFPQEKADICRTWLQAVFSNRHQSTIDDNQKQVQEFCHEKIIK